MRVSGNSVELDRVDAARGHAHRHGGARDHATNPTAAACSRCRAASTRRRFPTLWDSARRAVAEAPRQADRRRRRRRRLLRRRRRRALRRPAAPAARRQVEVANLKPGVRGAAASSSTRSVLEHDLDPEPPRRPAVEEIGARGVRHLARHPRRRSSSSARRPPRSRTPLRIRRACAGRTSGASASASASTRCRSSR